MSSRARPHKPTTSLVQRASWEGLASQKRPTRRGLAKRPLPRSRWPVCSSRLSAACPSLKRPFACRTCGRVSPLVPDELPAGSHAPPPHRVPKPVGQGARARLQASWEVAPTCWNLAPRRWLGSTSSIRSRNQPSCRPGTPLGPRGHGQPGTHVHRTHEGGSPTIEPDCWQTAPGASAFSLPPASPPSGPLLYLGLPPTWASPHWASPHTWTSTLPGPPPTPPSPSPYLAPGASGLFSQARSCLKE